MGKSLRTHLIKGMTKRMGHLQEIAPDAFELPKADEPSTGGDIVRGMKNMRRSLSAGALLGGTGGSGKSASRRNGKSGKLSATGFMDSATSNLSSSGAPQVRAAWAED